MQPRTKKIKYCAVDRLSNLPDSVIHTILSLIDAKQAVQTSVLSKKWKFHWAYTPSYTFNSSSADFIPHLLYNRKLFNLTRPMLFVNGKVPMSSLLVNVFYPYVLSFKIEELDVRNKLQIAENMRVVDRLSGLPDCIIHHILSLMDTKHAVQTCVLSKRWRDLWTYVRSLCFDYSSFGSWGLFKAFVNNVMKRRKSVRLGKLKLVCGDTVRVEFVERVFEYAKSLGVQEIDTDVIGELHRHYASHSTFYFDSDEDLSTTSTEEALSYLTIDFEGFKALTTLRVSSILPENMDVCYLDDDSNLQNLLLVNCVLSEGFTYFGLCASNLITLSVSDFQYCEKMSIVAPRLKFLNWSGEYPCLLRFDSCLELEEVNIHISPSPEFQMTETWFLELRSMVAGCSPAKFIKVLLDVPEVAVTFL